MTRDARSSLAQLIRSRQLAVAERVTEAYLARHPDRRSGDGERGRDLGLEAATLHVQSLAAAIDSGSTEAFEDHARWAARMLCARGVARIDLAEALSEVESALAPGLPPEERALLATFVRAGRAACQEQVPAPEPPGAGALADAGRLFLRAILDGRRKAAALVALEALREGYAPIDVYADVLQASLYEVGRLWEANRIAVADEHMATAITQYVLALMYEQLIREAEPRGRLVVTGLPGEQHHVGANIVADVLESRGWDVRFLGTNLPSATILGAIEAHRADTVGISMTMLFNVPSVRTLIAAIRDRFGRPGIRVVVGGAAFRAVPGLWRDVGADAFAADVRAASTLLGGQSRGPDA